MWNNKFTVNNIYSTASGKQKYYIFKYYVDVFVLTDK